MFSLYFLLVLTLGGLCVSSPINKHWGNITQILRKDMEEKVRMELSKVDKQLKHDYDSVKLELKRLREQTTFVPFVWKIEKYQLKKLKEKRDVKPQYSPHFFTHRNGYRVELYAFLNGAPNHPGVKGKYLTMGYDLVPGEYDAILPWPFMGNVTFTLLSQNNTVRNIATTVPKRKSDSYQRIQTRTLGAYKFVDIADLEKPAFLKDDTIFLKVDFELPNTSPEVQQQWLI